MSSLPSRNTPDAEPTDEDIRNTEWDFILVDAPTGYHPNKPNRMKSIYETYNLSNKKLKKKSMNKNQPFEYSSDKNKFLSVNQIKKINKIIGF